MIMKCGAEPNRVDTATQPDVVRAAGRRDAAERHAMSVPNRTGKKILIIPDAQGRIATVQASHEANAHPRAWNGMERHMGDGGGRIQMGMQISEH
jgi:hypothetical protein